MIVWPDEVVEAVARRRAILFLGSGVSRNSQSATGARPPLWEGFLKGLLPKIGGKVKEIQSFMRANDYLTACDLIKRRLDDRWENELEASFLTPHYLHAPIHEAIFKLDLSIVLTTNVDQIYERYAQNQTQNFIRVKSYYDPDVGRAIRGSSSQRLILKVHGCASTPQQAVFTRAQYADAVAKYSEFYRLLEALITTNVIIFVGSSLADPDLNLLLEKNARAFTSTPPHYLLTSSTMTEDLSRLYRDNYNIKIIPYRSQDNHKQLLDSLVALGLKVEEKRDEIAASRLW